MNPLKFLLCLGFAAVAAQAANNSPMAEWPKGYSVEMVSTVGATTNASVLYVDGDKMRTETNAGGMQMISIIRKDRKLSYTLMPAQKMVMENPLPDTPAPATTGGESVWEKIGSEAVNGVACTVYKVTAGGATVTYYLGADKFPVRMKTDQMTLDYKNFKAGAPDAALFEVPPGYSKPGEAPAAGSDNSGAGANNAPAASGGSPEATPPAPEPKKKKKLGGMLGR